MAYHEQIAKILVKKIPELKFSANKSCPLDMDIHYMGKIITIGHVDSGYLPLATEKKNAEAKRKVLREAKEMSKFILARLEALRNSLAT